MRWVIITGLVVLGLADALVLNLVAVPAYRTERSVEGDGLARAAERGVPPPSATEPEPVPSAPVPEALPQPPVETSPEPPVETSPEPPVETPPEPPVETPPEPEVPDPTIETPLPSEPLVAPPGVGVGGGAVKAPPIEPAYFATGSHALRPFVCEHLKQAVIVMRRQASLGVLLRGHTDRRGTEQNNIGLSRQRAEAVAEFLFEQGIDRRRVQTEGVGASQPASSGDEPEDWAKNRRVELIWR